ncbi:MAG: hypothetical protein KIT34_08590 [Cyanobacteria bacterium TGS_CYA1]|nr:hypothetical protein [Cyanobacteria bacterium TGS_CYA1]
MKSVSYLTVLLSVFLVSPASQVFAQSSSCGGGKTCGTGGIYIAPGRLSPSTAVYPAFGIPQPIGGGIFSIAAGRCTINMWKAPSGYYYPYCGVPPGWPGAANNVGLPIIISQQYNPPAAADPPVSTFIEDTTEFLDKKKKDKKISDRDYQNMSQRLKDLGSKERYLRNQASGTLDEHDESQLRQDVAQVLKELQWRLGRNEKY